jgi:REP element-mobilizing transposase RayT
MANTYTQLYIHFVFAVQNRLSLISEKWEEKLYAYITGIVENKKHKMMIIKGMPDHIHALISMKPDESASDLMYHVKRSSSLWINDNKLCIGKFSWQEGFGCFSYGKSQITSVIRYIEQQRDHHKRRSFKEEYLEILQKFDVDYDDKYIFKPIE